MTVANEASKIVLEIMTLYSTIKTGLQRFNVNDPLAKDIDKQLDLLIYKGFIHNAAYSQLKVLPHVYKPARFLKPRRFANVLIQGNLLL
jgi:hypothetical protein